MKIKNNTDMENNTKHTNKFRYIIEFDNCDNCPLKKFVDDDYSPTHTECERTNEYIEQWLFENEHRDYRNYETGVLDNCPFLKNNTITA